MPKAPPRKSTRSSKSQTDKPYTKSAAAAVKPAKPTKVKDPKQSHLYTDDNPSTTLHGTGFKDAETAHHTINIVSQRSLTYQWQVINTMYHRGKNHPAMRKGQGNESMKKAIGIFEHWLSVTYPEAREEIKRERKDFKPLLKREVVKRYLGRIRDLYPTTAESDDEVKDGKGAEFASMYVDLPKGKRLANVLVDDERPDGDDWEGLRCKQLTSLVNERAERGSEGEDGLWTEKAGASEWHLKCIAWAWSPVGERRLPP